MSVAVRHRRHPAWKTQYVSQIYERVFPRKGDAIAVGAVAHYLAEAAFWVLKRGEAYQPPTIRQPSLSRRHGASNLYA